MKSIQSQDQNSDLKAALDATVEELEKSGILKGIFSVERTLPPPNMPTETPAGYPHWTVQVKVSTKILGIIPLNYSKTICIVKEGFYDREETGRKEMYVILRSSKCAVIVKKNLDAYGAKHHASEVIYRT